MIRAEMTAHQAECLAAYAISYRPGQRQWTKTAVFDAITQAANSRTRDPLYLERAVLNAARDPKVVSPSVIPMPGRHWEQVGDVGPEPPRPRICDRCHRVSCPGGVGDQGEPLCAPEMTGDVADLVAAAKANVRPTWKPVPRPQEATDA